MRSRVALTMVFGLWVLPVLAQQPDRDRPTAVAEIFKAARPSVATISVTDRDGHESGVGVGFVIDAAGLIATNLHVIGQGRPFRVVLGSGQELTVRGIYASDPTVDLAIVEVAEQELPALPLGELAELKSGDPIVVLGNPHGLEGSVVAGVNSGVRNVAGRRMIQLAVPVEPGNSGGPVLDFEGRVQGVVTMKSVVSDNLGFAMDVAALRSLLKTPNRVSLERWLRIGRLDPAQWKTLWGAHWQPRGGAIVVEGRGEEFGGRSLCLWQADTPATPFDVAVDVRLEDESGAAGLVVHSDGGFRHYGFYPSGGKVRMTAFRGANVLSWQILHDRDCSHYLPHEFNTLRVRVEQDRLTCFVNDDEVYSKAGLELASGKVGLAKFRDTQAEFRNFQVAAAVTPSRYARQRLSPVEKIVDALPSIDQWTAEDLQALVESPRVSQRVLRLRAGQLESQAQQLLRLADDIRVRAACDRLAELLEGYEKQATLPDRQPQFDLLRAALLIAQLDEDHVDIDAFVREVDDMAAEIRGSLGADASDVERLAAMDAYLFQQNGFHGSRFDYYEPANSHMSRVISDRVGIPISLSVLYMELGRRLGLTIDGMNFPEHFMVRFVPAKGRPEVIDVFHEAQRVDGGQLEQLLDIHGEGRQLAKIRGADHREILERMLTNLRILAERRDDKESLLRYTEMMVVLEPDETVWRAQRAFLRFETGRKRGAVADLDWMLEKIGPHDPTRFEAVLRLRNAFADRLKEGD